MNTDERQLLTRFLDQLVQAKGIAKDPDADFLIRSALAQQPDAAYLLVQKSLIQEQALKNAKAQLDQLQAEAATLRTQIQQNNTASQVTPSSGSSSFLGNFFGGGNTAAPRPVAPAPQYAAPTAPSYAPQAQAPMMQQPVAASSSPFGGFLASAATTAAGVAGGAFLFEGVHSLFSGHHNQGDGSFLSSNNSDDGYQQQPVENVTVNNYYGSDDSNANNLTDNTDDSDDSNDGDDFLNA